MDTLYHIMVEEKRRIGVKLLEVFDSPYKWEYTAQDPRAAWSFVNNIYAKFDAQAGEYSVLLSSQKHENTYDVVFFAVDVDDSEGVIGTGTGSKREGGDAFRIFATVAAILEDFAANHDDVIYYFDAKEESRKKLYERFLRYVKRTYGWPTEQYDDHFIIQTYKS